PLMATVLLGVLCAGCVAVGVEGANITKDEVVYQRNIVDARNGDPEAQYLVGDALCCSINEGSGFYNTPKAMTWLCASARQGYAPAMFQAGKILSGDVVDGIRVSRRLVQGVVGTSTNLPVAYGWLRAAEANGVAEAQDRADEVWSEMAEAERAAAGETQEGALPELCTWEELGFE
ncbi:MAG: hypothetical protein AAFV62_01590, partial [Pseudomonadota bacterium]